MSDIKAKASGPLWTLKSISGEMCVLSLVATKHRYHAAHHGSLVPCRLLPGHGRYVPAELVARIEVALRPRYETEEERWERRLAQRTQERDNFRAVLSGEGYQNLDKIAAENRDCSQIGAEARRRTMEIIARADSAEAKLERIRVAAGKWKRTERYTDDGIPDAGDVALLDTLYAEFGKDGW